MQSMNMSKISRMQRSFRWQPHLPFVPVHLPYTEFAERYRYQYDTLPIVEAGPNEWTLNNEVARSWKSHVQIFSLILQTWSSNLAKAPMTITWVPDIRDYKIEQFFPTQKKARGYYWYYRTMIFALFAEFSFSIAARPKWKDSVENILKEHRLECGEKWLDTVDAYLGDFKYTKRAGVVIDTATTELWPCINRYHEKGVPTLMDVGEIHFYDRQQMVEEPFIHINDLNKPQYRREWPNVEQLLALVNKQLKENVLPYRNYGRCIPRLDIVRPSVQEVGGIIHERPRTTAWVNPTTQERMEWIQVTEPIVAPIARLSNEEDWVEFFARRETTNRRLEEMETDLDRQRRLSRIKDSLRINQRHSSGPTRKSAVFQWVQESVEEPGLAMAESRPPVWRKQKLTRAEVEIVWEDFLPTQRHYDSFHNEWHLMVLLDPGANAPDQDYDDADEEYAMAPPAPPVLTRTIAYLEEINVAPQDADGCYSAVHRLSSQITFLAPANLELWCYLTLGLWCLQHAQPPVIFRKAHSMIGFFIGTYHEGTPTYFDLQEFISYMVDRKFNHPRLALLSDLHPQHPRALTVLNRDLDISCVSVIHQTTIILANGSYMLQNIERTGYILRPCHDHSGFEPTWILVIFEATTVLQIIRNGWGSATLETLIGQLLRYGISFKTLVPAHRVIPEEIIRLNEAPAQFQTLSWLNKPMQDAGDYTRYVEIRKTILASPHGKAAFRSGGVLWRLAMETTANINEIIDDIMDGPTDMGTTRGEYFEIGGKKYYDDMVPTAIGHTICGTHGLQGCK